MVNIPQILTKLTEYIGPNDEREQERLGIAPSLTISHICVTSTNLIYISATSPISHDTRQ